MNRFNNFAFKGTVPNGGNSSPTEDSPSWLDARRPNTNNYDRQESIVSRAGHQSGKIPKKRLFVDDDSDKEQHLSTQYRHDTTFPSVTMADMLNKTKSESLQDIIRKKSSPKSKLVRESLLERSLEELEEYDPVAEIREKNMKLNARERTVRMHSRSANNLFDGSDEEAVTVTNKARKKKRLMVDSDEEDFVVPRVSKVSIDNDTMDLIETPESKRYPVNRHHGNNKNSSDDMSERRRSNSNNIVFNLTEDADLQDVIDTEGITGGDGDDDDGHGYDGEISKKDIVAKAKQVIRQCEAVSKNLRQSLASWGTASSGTSKAASSSHLSDNADCVNLLTISSPEVQHHHAVTATITNQALLNNEDISTFCPGLVLNPYQLVGVNWLKLLYENEVNGVLADDMGLGKTVQTIAFMGWLAVVAQNTPRVRRPHLIVVPASVLSNWENELDRFCPSLEIVRYHGSQNEKTELRHELRRRIPSGEVDVILTTYTLFERESNAKDRAFLMNQKFNFLILDEAHSIKNSSSSRYNNLNALKTKHRLLLSGTPVQNDLRELLALLSFLMPNVFNGESCEAMILAFNWDVANNAGKNSRTVGGVSLSQLKAMLAPFVLRRLKRDVLEHLSEKKTELVLLPPAESQKRIYEDIILSYARRKEQFAVRSQLAEDEARLLEGKIPGGRKKNDNKNKSNVEEQPGSEKSMSKFLTATNAPPPKQSSSSEIIDLSSPPTKLAQTSTDGIVNLVNNVQSVECNEEVAKELRNLSSTDAKHLFTALRKAANHPLLLRIHYQDEEIFEKIGRVVYNEGYFGFQVDYSRAKVELESFSDFDIHQLCLQYEYQLGKYALDASVLYDSPKMEYLRILLPRLQAEGHRMLIFSQWTRLLDLLEVFLHDVGMEFLRLDGSTPIIERQERIDLFNEDVSIPVFLLSTKAGGLGINLTSADTVILHDLDFNPENDKQAEDRCHRIGQTKPVTVYKLVTQATVDEDIYEMGERKRQLSQAVLSDDAKRQQSVEGEGEEDAEGDGKKKGASKKKGGSKKQGVDEVDDADIDAISRILSKALSRQGIQL